MDGGAWWAAVHGVAKSRTRLRDFTFTFHFSLSCIGESDGTPLQCSCLENPGDGGAWWAVVYGVAKSRTRLKWLNNSSIVILLTIFLILFYHVAGYLSHLNLFPLFQNRSLFSCPLAQLPFLILPFINIIPKKWLNLFFLSVWMFFPVEITDRSTDDQIGELEIYIVSSWISYPQLAIGSMNQTMFSLLFLPVFLEQEYISLNP